MLLKTVPGTVLSDTHNSFSPRHKHGKRHLFQLPFYRQETWGTKRLSDLLKLLLLISRKVGDWPRVVLCECTHKIIRLSWTMGMLTTVWQEVTSCSGKWQVREVEETELGGGCPLHAKHSARHTESLGSQDLTLCPEHMFMGRCISGHLLEPFL